MASDIRLRTETNGCPCGYLTDPKRSCRCNTVQLQRYLAKVSGPLLDRIDLHIDVPSVPYDKLLKVARTIADLADETVILPEHLAEAIQYRSLDRQLWT